MSASILIILICSIVQSLAGVGLLIFGTPALLLLGVPFSEALLFLLPSSLTISAFQIYEDRSEIDDRMKRSFLFWGIPFMGVSLAVALWAEAEVDLTIGVAVMLLVAGITRLFPQSWKVHRKITSQYRQPLVVLTGIVHGWTNMGGALIAVIANTLFTSKRQVRANIAFVYFIFALMQLLVLFLMQPHFQKKIPWIFPLISATCYLSVGRTAFHLIQEKLFQHLMTGLLILFGLILLLVRH
jgi:hypothetical protein